MEGGRRGENEWGHRERKPRGEREERRGEGMPADYNTDIFVTNSQDFNSLGVSALTATPENKTHEKCTTPKDAA